MESKNTNWTKSIFWLLLAVVVVTVYKTLDNIGAITNAIKNFLGIISPFLVGILISYILYVPCTKIEATYKKVKKIKLINKKARPLSILTVYFIVFILLVILINFILPPVIQSIVDLVNNFGQYYNIAVGKITTLPEDSIFKSEVAQNVINEVQNIDLKEIVNTEALTGYVQSVIGMLGGVFDIFVSIIVSIYILNGRKQIINFLGRLLGAIFEEKTYENINKYFNRTNQIFFKFLASQILDAVIVGILASVAMFVLNVKYAVLLGFMIGNTLFRSNNSCNISRYYYILYRRTFTSYMDACSGNYFATNRCKYNKSKNSRGFIKDKSITCNICSVNRWSIFWSIGNVLSSTSNSFIKTISR